MSVPRSERRGQPKRWLLAGVVVILLAIAVAWKFGWFSTPAPPPPREAGSAPRQTTAEQPDSSAVTSERPSTSPSPSLRLSAQAVLKYGSGAGEVGLVRGPGQSPVGPESFAVGKDGRVLVADVVNQRLVVYSTNGTFVRNVELPGIALGDVATDGQGRVYVYDQVRRSLHLYDTDGSPRGALDLNPKDIDTRGFFHVVGSAVYFADAAVRDVLVATVQNGVLVPPDQSVERVTEGIHGDSGRIYSMSVDKGQSLRLQVWDPAASLSDRISLQVPLPGVVAARYAGEDESRRFYVQTERLEGNRIILEVLGFNSAGKQVSATRMPENDYFTWTAKLVDVRRDGSIVQFLPQREQAKLNVFSE